jgi:hypothetical protein
LRQLAKSLGFEQKEPPLCYEDNKAANISTELNWADVLTKALVPKKHKDALEAILGSKEAYRLVVTQKGVLVQYADSYFLLATYA